MKKRYSIFVLTSLLFYTASYGQVKMRAITSFDYSYGVPSGDLHSFISDKAFDGAQLQYRFFVQRNLTLGIRTGWNCFKEKVSRAVYDTDKGTVSAVQLRYFHTVPVLLTGHYYLRSLHYVMPYIGAGVGGYWSKYEKWFGVVPVKKDKINFGVCPEAGVIIPFKNSGLGLIFSGKFNKVFYSYREIKNLNYFEAAAGIYFGYPMFEKPVPVQSVY
ncbi:MAG: hypothetical protein ACJ75J_15600 [Cytophagaceae bacterium]|jgi:opacity protein-like surface antigen